MKRRVIEWIKSLLIAALALNAVILIARLSFSENRAASLGDVIDALKQRVTVETVSENTSSTAAAALPISVALTGENGRCGLVDRAAIRACFDRITPLLAESLGSAEAPVEVEQTQWQQLLTDNSIFLSYDCTVPLRVLAGWCGSEIRENCRVNMLVLHVQGDDTVTVSYSDGVSCYSARTAASPQTLRELIASARPNGAKFAFELEKNQKQWNNVAPCSLIAEGMHEALPVYIQTTVSNADIATVVMEALELNPYMDKGYTDRDGWDTYLFSVGTLRLSGDGTATFRAAADASASVLTLSAADGAQQAVEMTRHFVQRVLGPYCGQAEIGLSSLAAEGDSMAITYAYYLNGHKAADVPGAVFTIEGDRVTDMRLNWRGFEASSATTSILVPRLECAVYPRSPRCTMKIGYSAGNPIWLMEG